jgi:hypothetical protein
MSRKAEFWSWRRAALSPGLAHPLVQVRLANGERNA